MTGISALLGPRLPSEMTADRMGCGQPDVDPDWFFDESARHEARTVCIVRCTVRASCLAWIIEVEQGLGRTAREGVYAGLDPNERWDMDTTAPGERRRLPAADDPQCGSAAALLRHLQHGEDIDSKCWSAEVHRAVLRTKDARKKQTRGKKTTAAPVVGKSAEPVIAAALEAAAKEPPPAAACPRAECNIRTPHGHRTRQPELVLTPEPEPLPVPAPAAAPAEPPLPQSNTPAATADTPECGTPEAIQRHERLGEPVDPLCWNAAGRRRHQRRHLAQEAS